MRIHLLVGNIWNGNELADKLNHKENINPNVLNILSNREGGESVLRAVAIHPNTPEYVLERFGSEPSIYKDEGYREDVCQAIKDRQLPEECKYINYLVRIEKLKQTDVETNVLEHLSTYRDAWMQINVVLSPSTSDSLLKRM